MDAAGVLRRSLILWGWGHIALGDRRGWILLLLQPVAIAGLAFAAWQLIDGTRWLAVFLPLVALLVLWIGQAVHAHRRAVSNGAAPGGELQLAFFLPVVLAVVSAFWLVGGRHGSPASAVEAYMEAWQANRPDVAIGLFAINGPIELGSVWARQGSELRSAIESAREAYGPQSGLDPARPFRNLRVTQTGPTTFIVELVRTESYQTTLLGFIPTAGQRTVVVDPVLQIDVLERHVAGYLESTVWRLSRVQEFTKTP